VSDTFRVTTSLLCDVGKLSPVSVVGLVITPFIDTWLFPVASDRLLQINPFVNPSFTLIDFPCFRSSSISNWAGVSSSNPQTELPSLLHISVSKGSIKFLAISLLLALALILR